jgi:hypothetical protein
MRKTLISAVFLLFILAMPAWADVKVTSDSTIGWDDGSDDLSWQSGFQTSGNWSLASNAVFCLDDKIAIDREQQHWQGTLDRCYLQLEPGPARLNLGRQGVSWGIGWFFRPTDLITPLTPLAQEETRSGKDLAVLRWATSALTATDFIAGNHLYALRSEWQFGPTHLRLLGIYQPEYVNAAGYDFQGGLYGFYGEGVYRWADTEGPDQGRYAGLVGWQKVVGASNQLFLEYFRNELRQSGETMANLLSQNKNHELIYSDRNYLAAGLKIPWDQLTTLTMAGISNLDDRGCIIEGIGDFLLNDNLEVVGILRAVAGPEDTEFWTMGRGSRLGVALEIKYFF